MSLLISLPRDELQEVNSTHSCAPGSGFYCYNNCSGDVYKKWKDGQSRTFSIFVA